MAAPIRDSMPGVPRQPFDSSTEILQLLLQEVRDLRASSSEQARESREEVRGMREDLSEVKGAVIALETLQKTCLDRDREWSDRQSRFEAKFETLRNDFDEHKDTEGVWQAEHSSLLTSLHKSVEQVLPLAKSHEEIVLQAKGAIKATKIGYAMIAAMVGSGGILGGHLLTKSTNATAAAPAAYVTQDTTHRPTLEDAGAADVSGIRK